MSGQYRYRTGMVSYQRWVSIVFDIAKQKGAQTGPQDNAKTLSVAGSIWSDRKDELKDANQSTARDIADQEVVVR